MCKPSHRWHRYRAFRYGPPHLPPGRDNKRRFMLIRFAALFGSLILFFLMAVILTSFLLERFLHPNTPLSAGPWLAACGIPLIFFALVSMLGRWTFRRFGTPMAELMEAADAVAKGDLTVRVRENIPGEFGEIAHSFNHMIVELERAEGQRRNLTADVAHELRTPLHIIQGNLEGILDGVYQPSSESINATLEETRLLTRLVEDLQTISLAEAGQLPLHHMTFPVADLLADVATSFAGQADEQGVAIRVDLPEDSAQIQINGDPDRLNQVLSNLVANSLRYTSSAGYLILRAQAVPGGLRLSVEDNGAGIPAEDLPFIFDRFWRGDRSRSRIGGTGSGLGLAIAKQLVQAHGGTIQAESQSGRGTVITIDLPDLDHLDEQTS